MLKSSRDCVHDLLMITLENADEAVVISVVTSYEELRKCLHVDGDVIDANTAIVDGYNAFFSFSRKRSGYSGVATYCRKSITPFAAEEGLSNILQEKVENNTPVGYYGDLSHFPHEELVSLDNEGRAIVTHHDFRTSSGVMKKLAVINVYCPRADPEKEDRKFFKMRFYELLQIRAEALQESGSHVIIVGDINTSHKVIDHCDPGDDEIPNILVKSSCIYFQEFLLNPGRKWLDNFLVELRRETSAPAKHETDNSKCDLYRNYSNESNGKEIDSKEFVDTFRYFYPDKLNAFTCWQTLTNARQTNYGTRLDYIFADQELAKSFFQDSYILPDIEGSDHCPVKAELKCTPVSSNVCPCICSKFWPEFSGKQQKLMSFFSKCSEKHDNNEHRDSAADKNICCALCEESTIFCLHIDYCIVDFFRYGAIANFTSEPPFSKMAAKMA
ncbi:DNA-(apurinic or apyrimidinic site) lyase 2 [Nymphon striatum]|nr:DNA-(apurinic or apyrimidinic site) lyase 2 [Nymphon striatum]